MERPRVSADWDTWDHDPGHVSHVSSAVSSPRTQVSESSLNSMEYWDYSVELECITGQQDLQLAAELGKTLLERNKELELSLKHQQSVIDDQTMEIEYLAKQAAALRDMNDSRLKVYEQLEVSMVELESTNKRLCEEGLGDKERIRDLGDTVRSLEIKCEELQRLLDEVILRARPRPGDTGHSLRPDVTCQIFPPAPDITEAEDDIEEDGEIKEEALGRESPGTRSGTQESGYGSTCTDSLGYRDIVDTDLDTCLDTCDTGADGGRHVSRDKLAVVNSEQHLDVILETEEVIRLNQQISCLRAEIEKGDCQIKELEEQMSSLINENRSLVKRLERGSKLMQAKSSSVEEEVLAVEQVSQGRLCRKCLAVTETPSTSDLCLILQQAVTNWSSEVSPVLKRWLQTLIHRVLSHPSSVSWLDKWLVLVALSTVFLGCVRALLSGLSSHL